MKMQLIVLFTILITLLNSCGVTKTKLTEKELKWITVYKQNDTLIYKSSQGVLDTSYIVKSEAYYPEYIPIEVHDKYLPHSAVVLYKNKNLEHKPDGNQLIYMVKKYPDKQVRVFINYLSSGFIILDLANNEIEKYKSGKIYEFGTYHSKAESWQPKKIFWHEDYGIIKYITHDDEVWERINLPE
jgi:hypothetical protein